MQGFQVKINLNPALLSFKASAEVSKPPQNGAPVTNPMQNQGAQVQNLQQVTPSYNVTIPSKYNFLGVDELPCGLKAYTYKAENGHRVVIIPMPGHPIDINTFINTGSMKEIKPKTVAHILEHEMFNGSVGLKPGEFFKIVNKSGASTNASTGFASTNYYTEFNSLTPDDLETQTKAHFKFVGEPLFFNEAFKEGTPFDEGAYKDLLAEKKEVANEKIYNNIFKKEQQIVNKEIQGILDDPENLAINNTTKNLYGLKHIPGDLIGGTVENINNLTLKDLSDYYGTNYSPTNIVAVVTGDVDPEETIALVAKYYRPRNTAPKQPSYSEKLTPISKTVREDLYSTNTSNAIICIGFDGPKNNNTKDKILLDAVQYFLAGSPHQRINKALEEIQTNAFMSTDRVSSERSVILSNIQTSEQNSETALREFFRVIVDLKKNPPTKQDLDTIKKTMKSNVAQVFESSGTVNSVVGAAMLDNDLKSVTEFEKVIDNLKAEDIVDFAKRYFDINKASITVIHPATANAQSINQNYRAANNIAFTGKADGIKHKEAIDISKTNQYVAVNNMSIVTNDLGDKDLATFDLALSADNPANVQPGIVEVFGAMINYGSKFKDEKTFFADLEKQGIRLSFDASRRAITIKGMSSPADIVNAMKKAKEAIFNPPFTEKNLLKAKNMLRESLQGVPKNAQEVLLARMFKGQFYGTTTRDILNNLDNIKLSDVQGLYNYIMSNAQGQVVISAPFEKNPNLKNDLFKELNKDFPMLKPAKSYLYNSYIPVEETNVEIQKHNRSQADIQVGYKFKTNDNLKDAVIFNLLNTILGGTPSSRLFSDLREQQKLAYQVGSKLGYFDSSGFILLNIKTTTDDPQTGTVSYDNVKKSLDGFNVHVKKLMNENVSDEELESAKLTLKNRVLNSVELTADKNMGILEGLNSFYGVSMDNQILEIVDKITADDIKAAANYIFSTKPTISIVATKNTIENNEDYLKSLGDIVNADAKAA